MKFCAGDFWLADVPWLGRQVDVDSSQIETLTENNQCYTTQDTDNILKMSKSIKLLVKMKKCVLYFTEKTKWTF